MRDVAGVARHPTGGYLVGFVLAALFVGYFTDGFIRRRRFVYLLGVMLFANFVLIHIPGLLHLRLWYRFAAGSPVSLKTVLLAGMIPFAAGDVLKAIAAAGIATGVTPGKTRGR